MRTVLKVFFLLLLVTTFATPTALAGKKPIRVLIISGQNNHNWRATTPALKAILEKSGRFVVGVEENPAQLNTKRLKSFDLIVSNWNMFGKGASGAANWSDEARAAYLDFVRSGKGHVVVHAGGSSFYDWPEYQELIGGASWKNGKTGHGAPHEFPVRIAEKKHAITQGVADFRTRDELWNRTGFSETATVLAEAFSASDKSKGTGAWEPMAVVNRFGKGRNFSLVLGHDAKMMENPGFQTLLLRGAEWAATGKVADASTKAMRWNKGDDFVELLSGDQSVWRFHHGSDKGKPYFHPVALPGGPTLTQDAPPDHPWHLALWFSWKFINGVNYWETERGSDKSAGTTAWSDVDIQTNPDHSARIAMRLTYAPQGAAKALMTETRQIKISPPAADGSYSLDWTMVFKAGEQDVVLDRTPLPNEKGGKVYGGYAGLSARLAENLTDWGIATTNEAGAPDTVRARFKATAVDYNGRVGEQEAGMTMIDHPENLNAPSPWYIIRDPKVPFAYFSPAVIQPRPHTLAAGQSMTLRYRVMVHPGRWDSERLKREQREYIGQ